MDKSVGEKPFLVITGMHRSGTSFLARALNLRGTYLGDLSNIPSTEWKPAADNLKGHWEHEKIIQLADKTLSLNKGTWDNIPKKINLTQEIGTQIKNICNELIKNQSLSSGFKDPRILTCLESWSKFLPKNFIILGIFRHPLKVAESLKTRNNFSYKKSLILWKYYNEKLLSALEKYEGFLINFDWPKEKLLSELDEISLKLGLVKSIDISDWYSKELFHSDKIFQSNYYLSHQIESIYSKLIDRSLKNNKSKIQFSYSNDNYQLVVESILKNAQSQENNFVKINYKNLEKIKKQTNEITKLESSIKSAVGDVSNLQTINLLNQRTTTEKEDEIKKLAKITTEKEDEIKKLAKTTTEKEDEIKKLAKTTTEKEEQLNELEKIATERADEIKKLAKITTEKEDEIKKLAKTTTEKEEQLNELEKISTERKEQLNELAEISTEREEQLNELEKTSTERKEQLNELEKISTERADEIKKLAKITSEKEDQIEKLKIIGEDKDIQIDIRQKIGVDKDIQIDILQKISGEKEGHITELQKHLQITQDQIRAIHQSIVFRLLRKYDNSIGKVIPLRPKKYLKSTMDELSASDQYKNIKIALETLTLTKKDIICFPIINWDYRIQRSQHLLRKFSQNGHRVFYLKTHLRNLSNPYQIKLLEENIYEVELNSPKFFDIYKDQLDMNLVDNLIFSFQKLSNDLKLDALCFVEFPTWKDLVLRIRTLFNYRIVFDCLDDFASFPGVNSARKNEENSLFELSDLVTTSSDFLKNKASEFTKKIVLLPNAGEHSHFHKTFNENILNQYTKPIVGYFGSIAEWFDTDLIEFLAKERPNFTFVLLGHTFGADIQKLENLSNVHFLGEQPYSELPRYLQDFDACLIPFKMNQLIEATHPVKIYEYFAAGKPVVSTYFPEIEHFRELCYVAKNKDDFLAQLDLAINEKNTKLNKKRIEFSSKNTWDDRFQTLYSQLKKLDSFDILQHRYTSSIIKSKI